MVLALTALLAAPALALEEPPNFLVLVTDDQRHDTLWAMEDLSERLLEEGTRFEHAYVATPLCCPFRGAFLSGGYPSRETGLMANTGPNGGPDKLVDDVTLATRFQDGGYTTGLVGKYLTHYDREVPRIPPGWSHFDALTEIRTWYDHQSLVGRSGSEASTGELVERTDYITRVQQDEALAFLDEHAEEPFLLVVAFAAPHSPYTPPIQDRGTQADYDHRPPSYDEADISDKPGWLQDQDPLDAEQIADIDDRVRSQLECLPSLDRAATKLMDRLALHGVLERTYVLFTSDNGMLWGEHRLAGKGTPYEESARVPLVVFGPEVAPGVREEEVLVDLDLPATLADLAGLEPRTAGTSLVPALRGEALERGPLRIENLSPGGFPSWSAVVSERVKVVSWSDGDLELYDLVSDPYELENLAEDPSWAERLAELTDWLDQDRGLTLPPITLPVARVGEAYDVRLEALGGTPPLTWEAVQHLPPGLELTADGHLVGTPELEGGWGLQVAVEDSRTSPQTGRVHRYERNLDVVVEAAARGDSGDDGDERCGCGPGGPGAGLLGGWLALTSAWLARRRRFQNDTLCDDG